MYTGAVGPYGMKKPSEGNRQPADGNGTRRHGVVFGESGGRYVYLWTMEKYETAVHQTDGQPFHTVLTFVECHPCNDDNQPRPAEWSGQAVMQEKDAAQQREDDFAGDGRLRKGQFLRVVLCQIGGMEEE